MILYPAIDLKDGQVVRLEQGRADRAKVYFGDAGIPAAAWKSAGAQWIHVVDLDGAFSGESRNREALRRILEEGLHVQFGGGMRDRESVRSALDAGVSRAVIGTRALEDPAFIEALIKEFGSDRIAVGIDARDGKVAVKGWVEVSEVDALAFARQMEGIGVRTLIYTDISRDGMMQGPNFAAQRTLLESVSCRVIASGGVTRDEDVVEFGRMSEKFSNLDGVIIGRALYEGTVNLGRHLGTRS